MTHEFSSFGLRLETTWRDRTPEQVDQTGRLLWSGFMLVDNVPSTPLLLSELATLKLPKDHLGGLVGLVGLGWVGLVGEYVV